MRARADCDARRGPRRSRSHCAASCRAPCDPREFAFSTHAQCARPWIVVSVAGPVARRMTEVPAKQNKKSKRAGTMNKDLYRVVFNAARGLRMVVPESARSAAEAATGTALASIAAALALLIASAGHAPIIPEPFRPRSLRPQVLATPNGVPLVNIRTPSAAGVSRNVYSQFDVDARGAILNNARSGAPTQLGGTVGGNPGLARG